MVVVVVLEPLIHCPPAATNPSSAEQVLQVTVPSLKVLVTVLEGHLATQIFPCTIFSAPQLIQIELGRTPIAI